MHSEDAYVSTREAAELLGISLRTAQLWVESGVLLAWKTSGGHRRILRRSVDELLTERSRTAQNLNAETTNNAATLKIVVVEDDPDITRLMKFTLGDLSPAIDVRNATDGFKGLVLIGQFHPDLVIADLNMPGMDGFQMIHSLIGSELAPKKIVVSTALSASDIEARGGLPAEVEVLQKPYSLDLLENIVKPFLMGK